MGYPGYFLNWKENAETCSGLRPVKQNIPIWSVTCCQLWVEPSFFRPATSCSLILMMRLAMPCTSSSLWLSTTGLTTQCKQTINKWEIKSWTYSNYSGSFWKVIPQWAELWRVENSCCDSGTVHWWVGINWPDEDFELGLNPLCLFCIITNHSETSHTLTCGNNMHQHQINKVIL